MGIFEALAIAGLLVVTAVGLDKWLDGPEPTRHPCGCPYRTGSYPNATGIWYEGPEFDRTDYEAIWVRYTDGKKREYYPGYRFTYRCHRCGDTFAHDYGARFSNAVLDSWEGEEPPAPVRGEEVVGLDEVITPSLIGGALGFSNILSGTSDSKPPYRYNSKIEEPPSPPDVVEQAVEEA